ncbi:hypothetical protein [Kitasatospora sp. A2-31]|uniref:hypothetical protein n=1 Tax=Kitasatospora sp. A2-31 TaxID=2916414 RepID=UPI001EE85D93|nr:hypothetical protein [Kitasatospora sp. A2-31]MCG6493422.1 hypothetical protein [Kitasatospora sp. A2-31]
MLRHAIANAAVPVRAIIAGSPVLAARLWAPAGARLDQASQEREAIAKAIAETRAAELAKLTDEKAIAERKAAHAKADRAARAEKRDQAADVVVGASLVAVVAGPVSWALVGPWVPVATWSGIGVWCIAAMMHAPRADETAPKVEPAEPAAPAAAGEPDDTDEWIQDSPPEAVLWALIRHTAALTRQGTAAHLQAVLEEGQRRGEFGDWTVADLTEELASYGVPVVGQKKLTVEGRNLNRSAVLLAALPEADSAPVPAIRQPVPTAAAQSAA